MRSSFDKHVPLIRFPGFTESWEQRKVKDVCSISTGKSNTQDKVDDGEYPFYVRSPIIEHSNKFLFDEEAVLTVGDGVGTGKVFHYVNGKYDLHQRVYRLFGFSEDTDAKFFYHWFSSHFYDRVMSMTAKTSVDSVRLEMISDMDFIAPSVDEQRRIASSLGYLDNIITLHQRKCDELIYFKKGLLQQMFPQPGESIPRVRFPGFTEPWEQRKFGDIAQRQSESSISDDENPCIEYEDIVSESGSLNKNVYEKQSCKKGIKFTSNDVLYGKLRPYLHNWLNPDFSGVAVGDWWVLRPVSADKNFLFRLIQTSQYDAAANQSSGTKMPRADWKHVSSIEFMMPTSIEEQSQIAAVFDNLDNLITLHQRKCDELKVYKKGLIQNMFV